MRTGVKSQLNQYLISQIYHKKFRTLKTWLQVCITKTSRLVYKANSKPKTSIVLVASDIDIVFIETH